jgi:hypothetical protein
MNKRTDLSNQVFTRLTAVSFLSLNGRGYWLCECECGNKSRVPANRLLSGRVKSCGCLKAERIAKGTNLQHGLSYTSTHAVWASMKSRCTNRNQRCYPRYGGRGISVCERWLSFVNFYADMGDKPDGMSLDRIDPNGNYEPSNCRWATKYTQANNTRTNRFLHFNGETRSVADWGRHLGISAKAISDRINKHKWTVERALSTPLCK